MNQLFCDSKIVNKCVCDKQPCCMRILVFGFDDI